jgi:hypothetical protein
LIVKLAKEGIMEEWTVALREFNLARIARNPSSILEFVTEYSAISGVPILVILRYVQKTAPEDLAQEIDRRINVIRSFYGER